MKTVINILFLILITCAVIAQDVIIKKNTEELKVKVVEVEDTKVKYKLFDNLEGPIYSINKSDIFMIKYANGKKETFNEQNFEEQSKLDKANRSNKEIFSYKRPLQGTHLLTA